MAKNENSVKVAELRNRNEAEVSSLLKSKLEELHKSRFKQALGQLRQTHTLRALRKDIARLKTVLAQRTKSTVEERA